MSYQKIILSFSHNLLDICAYIIKIKWERREEARRPVFWKEAAPCGREKEAGLELEEPGGHNMLYREKGCKKRCIQGEKI